MIKQLFKYGRAGRSGAIQQMVDEWLLLVLPVAAGGIVLSWWTARGLNWWGAVVLGGFVLVYAIYFLTPGARQRIQQWTVLAKREIRHDYLRGLFTPSLADSQELTSNKVIQRDLAGIGRLDSFYGVFLPAICASGFSFLLLIGLAIAWRSWLWLLPILCFLLMGVGMMCLQKISPNINRQYLQGFLRLGGRFLDDLGGMNTLVMYGAQKRYGQSFAEDAEFFRGKTMALLKYQLQSLFILNGLVFATMGAGAFVLYPAVANGGLSIVQAGVLWLLLAQLLVAERQLGYFFHIVMSTRPALKNIFRVIAAGQETPPTDVPDTTVPVHSVTFAQAGFRYPDGQPLWQDVSFVLQPGQLYGLVGENGTGKSTLARILRGELAPTAGQVQFNQTNIDQLTTADFLQHVGYLNDHPYLFSGTIAENINLGVRDQTDWWQKVRQLGLCAFVETLPEGLSTPIGENGRFLSPGQRQQIAFARLVLMNKDIYIFDEATANIDADNVQVMMTVMKRLSESKIVLCITHEWRSIEALAVIHFLTNQHITTGAAPVLYQDNAGFKRLLDTQKEMEAAG